MAQTSITPSIFDPASLAALKSQARNGDKAALKAAAQQFEALFLQMVLKSMRDATPSDGLFDSEQTRLYESLLDQQLSQVLAARGNTGLAAVIERQLASNSAPAGVIEGGLPLRPPATPYPLATDRPPLPVDRPTTEARPLPLNTAPSQPQRAPDTVTSAARQFVDRVLPYAIEASRQLGVPADFMVAQAALETGWGRAEIRYADGRPSYNVFGIKAGGNWNGAVAEAVTTEYVDGVAQTRTERFRAYGSYAEAFADYARLLGSNRRYAGVVASADGVSFARELQRAGYASDPEYATKLGRVLTSPALRTALAT